MTVTLRILLSLVVLPLLLTACGGDGNDDASGNAGIGPIRTAPDEFDMQVVNILPPGQSGHIDTLGQVQGLLTGNPGDFGPHIDDQRIPYWSSEFKPGGFLDISEREPVSTPREGVRIYRDDFGVPAVYGDTAADVWFGAGYAIAEDRLFLLDAVRRTARGSLAELTGPGDVPADIQTRILTYSEAEYQAMLQGLSAEAQTAVAAYRDGVNARIAEVRANPLVLLPIEYTLLQMLPEPISSSDIMAAGVLMTRLVAAAGGDEMDNVVALQQLVEQHGEEVGKRIFRDVIWQDDRKAAVTVPDGEFSNITTPKGQRDAVFEAMVDYALGLPADLQHGPGTGHAPEPSPLGILKLPEDYQWPADPQLIAKLVKETPRFPQHVQASYNAVIAPQKTADGSALLVNGPQLGYAYPTQLVELEVHGGGYDARGSTVPGLPVVGIGYTDITAWGVTTGNSKTIDSFIETLAEGDPHRYLHDGEVKEMDCRNEVVNYRLTDPVAGAPVGPALFNVTVEACRTVHGPVVARSADGQFARSVQYAMWMREVETADAILRWNRVRSFEEFHESMKMATWNENTMYADAAGNIAYYHPGLHPLRDPGGDQRLPLPGDGSFDHQGMMAFEDLPHSINPEQGWLANWNNKPALGWGENSGGDASSLPAGPEGRVTNWQDLLAAREDFTFADLAELDKRIGRIDPRARAFKPLFLSISGDPALTAKQQALLDILAGWDGDHYNPDINLNNAAARDRPGETIFDVLVKTLVNELFVDVLPAEWFAIVNAHGSHLHDAQVLDNLAVKQFEPQRFSIPGRHDFLDGREPDAVLREVVVQALTQLETTYGANTDPQDYRRVHPRDEVCSLTGITGPCLDMPHQDRGSWIHLVGFVPE